MSESPRRSWEARAPWMLPVVAVLLAVAPLALLGFPRGHDWSLELARVGEYRAALAEGPFPPAWAGNAYAGFGAPVFVFYPPLFAAAASAASGLAGTLAGGAAWTLAALLALGAAGMAALARAAAVRRRGAAARVAAVAFVGNPYLLCDAYLRNANAELAALCLAPWALLGVLRAETGPRAGAVIVAAGLAAVILAHNQTALVVMGLVLVGAAILPAAGRRLRTTGAALAGAAGALAMTAFFWAPALYYRPLMRSEEVLRGKFDFHHHFATWTQAFGWDAFYGAGALVPVACAIGVAGALRAPAGRTRRLLAAGLAGAAVFAFLLSAWSEPLWETLPLLPYFQFPWRMLGPLALLSALVLGPALALLLRGAPRRLRGAAEGAVLVLVAANALPTLLSVRPPPEGPAARLERLFASGEPRQRRFRVTAGDEYLPRGADPALLARTEPPAPPVLRAGPGVATRVRRDRPTHLALRVEAPAPAEVVFGRFSFPGWRARAGGRELPVGSEPDGTLAVRVPEGRWPLDLRYAGPPLRRALLAPSAVAFGVWLVAALAGLRRRAYST